MTDPIDKIKCQPDQKAKGSCLKRQQLIALIKEKFGRDLPLTDPTIIALADKFNQAQVREILSKLEVDGNEIKLSDLPLLIIAANNSELKEKLFNREGLIQYVKAQIYSNPATARVVKDRIENAPPEIDSDGRITLHNNTKAWAEELAPQNMDALTQRPDPSLLSSAQLLRLQLLHKGLQTAPNQKALSAIVRDDIKDENSEHGGAVELNADGSISLKPGPSKPCGDMGYDPVQDLAFSDSLVSFHIHSAKESEKYAGPSGWEGGGKADKADIGYVIKNNLTDLVITVLDASDPAKLLVNIDLYYKANSIYMPELNNNLGNLTGIMLNLQNGTYQPRMMVIDLGSIMLNH